MGEVWELEEGG